MMNANNFTARRSSLRQTVIAASICLAFGHAYAQTSRAERDQQMRMDFATPDSTIGVGIGFVSHDNRRFGEYRGLENQGAYGLLNLNLISRDDSTGTWMKLKGRNLGLDSRDLRFDHERQGDWSYFLDASQLTRHEPLIVNTGLQGIGTSAQTISAAAPKRNLDLKVDHDIYSFGLRKFVVGGFQFRASYKQDEKHGERMFGRGTTNVIEFLTEPIDRITRQWDLVASYADKKLQLSGGYSGSSFDNRIPVLTATGGNTNAAAFGASWIMALPPSNHAHQFHLSGGYNWSDSTRTSFKVSRSVALQNEGFDPVFAPRLAGSPGSLDGKVVTTLAFADLTLRPMDKLDVTGILRFEDRDDQTPEKQYLTAAAPSAGAGTFPYSTAGVTGFYKPRSLKQLKGTLEAGYQLDDGYRLVAAVEQEDMKRNAPSTYRRVGFREKTDETTERLELKRALSETLNGSVALLHSERGGSEYIPDTYSTTAVAGFPLGATTNQVNALLWADRRRDKLRLMGDWVPEESWSIQFIADYSTDKYSGRNLGPRKGEAQFVSGDATYAINDKWKLTAWISQERTLARQAQRSDEIVPSNAVALGYATSGYNILWQADLRNVTTAWGVSLKGKLKSNLEVGADLSSSTDVAEHNMGKTGGTGTAAVNSLPDYFYRQLSLKLFADYALEKNSGIRGDVVFDRRRNNDWTWQNWIYNGSPAAVGTQNSDGTTVGNATSENTTFVGATYYYRWR
jgi:MtrB/PioB family decaheme-associated outer membrane protein